MSIAKTLRGRASTALLTVMLIGTAADAQQPRRDLTPLEIMRAVDLARWTDAAQVAAAHNERTTLPADLSPSRTLFARANALQFAGSPDSAVMLYHLARTRAEQDADRAVVRWSYFGEALTELAHGFVSRADSLLRHGAQLATADADSALLARILLQRLSSNGFATNAMRLASLDSARRLATSSDMQVIASERCLRTQFETDWDKIDKTFREAATDAARSGARRAETACVFALGVRALGLGRLVDASFAFRAVDSLTRLMQDRALRASGNQWFGFLQLSRGRPQVAERFLEPALADASATSSLNTLAYVWLNLGMAAAGTDDASRATRLFDNAEQLFGQLGNVRGQVDILITRAYLVLSSRDFAAATHTFARADSLARVLNDAFRIDHVRVGRIALAIALPDTAKARRLLDEEETWLKTQPGNNWNAEQQQLRGLLDMQARRYDAALGHFSIAMDEYNQTQRSIRFSMAMAMSAAQACNGHAREGASRALYALDTLDAYRATLSNERRREENSSLRQDPKAAGPASIASLVQCLARSGAVDDAFLIAERVRDVHLRDALRPVANKDSVNDDYTVNVSDSTRITAVTLGALKRTLPDSNTMMLSFVASDPRTPVTLFAISRRDTRVYTLSSPDSLRPVIERLRTLLESGRDASTVARALGQALLAPALRTLPRSVTRLVIVPDAELFNVPWNVLEIATGPIGTRFGVAIVPSATVASAGWTRTRSVPAFHVLAYGAPTLSLDSLPLLPGSAEEASSLVRRDAKGDLRLGKQATESSLKHATLSGYSVLHLAAHARPATVGVNGSAGIVFLAPSSDDDGFLEASEITHLQLNGALVVLSACGTATTQPVFGEGARSLATAFLQAGAGAVLATQWSVRDRDVQPLVQAFFDEFAKGTPADESLRRAQTKLRARSSVTRDWSEFTLIGDGQTRVRSATEGAGARPK